MNITENYNSAASRFGEQLAREMLSAGIPDKYLLSACRFHCLPPNKTIDFLKIQFRQWMTYVVPFNKQIDVNNLTYEQFDKIIRDEQQKHVCPNKFYDDGNITIGEFKNKKDAALCPLKPIYDSNYGFCVCSELGFNKYNKQGYRIIVIIDKSKILANDITKYVFALVKDGGIDMWNANNNSMKADTWKYINNLPKKAREALLSFVKSTNNQENKQNTKMKTENRKRNVVRLTESQLKQMIAESVKNVLNEIGDPGTLIHGTHRNEDLIPAFMSELFRNDHQKARKIWTSSLNLLKALCDQKAGIETNWWDSEEATEICMELQDALQDYAPEGHYFGSHIGDGSDFGYWKLIIRKNTP